MREARLVRMGWSLGPSMSVEAQVWIGPPICLVVG